MAELTYVDELKPWTDEDLQRFKETFERLRTEVPSGSWAHPARATQICFMCGLPLELCEWHRRVHDAYGYGDH